MHRRGELVRIESFKHPSKLHRIWKQSVVLYEDDQQIVVANEDVEVIQPDGREDVFLGLSIIIFPKNEWHNTVLIFDESMEFKYFYSNIASPVKEDCKKNVITYIDYDLDVITHSDLRFEIVDQDEYMTNRNCYSYPIQVIREVENAVNRVTAMIQFQQGPFAPEIAPFWYRQYLSLKRGDG